MAYIKYYVRMFSITSTRNTPTLIFFHLWSSSTLPLIGVPQIRIKMGHSNFMGFSISCPLGKMSYFPLGWVLWGLFFSQFRFQISFLLICVVWIWGGEGSTAKDPYLISCTGFEH